jgi:hypothetical protein
MIWSGLRPGGPTSAGPVAGSGTKTSSGLRPGGPTSAGHVAGSGTKTSSGLRPGGPTSAGHVAGSGTYDLVRPSARGDPPPPAMWPAPAPLVQSIMSAVSPLMRLRQRDRPKR